MENHSLDRKQGSLKTKKQELSELADLKKMLQEQQAELATLREALVRKNIVPLAPTTTPAVAANPQRPDTSRRKMLRKMGLAVLAGGAALGITAATYSPADAKLSVNPSANIGTIITRNGASVSGIPANLTAGLFASPDDSVDVSDLDPNYYAGVIGITKKYFQNDVISIGVLGTTFNGLGVRGISTYNTGVDGISSNGTGVAGKSTNANGVEGRSAIGAGVYGQSDNGHGVYGKSDDFYGVYGQTITKSGVLGSSTSGNGAEGSSDSGSGVYGYSIQLYGVYGSSNDSYGVYGSSSNDTGIYGETYEGTKPAIIANNLDTDIASAIALQITRGGLTVKEAGIGSKTVAFIHKTIDSGSGANISGTATTIDNPFCNNNPTALLFVTHNRTPGEGTSLREPIPVGVSYDSTSKKWTIYHEDNSAMTNALYFNVLVINS